MQGVYVLSIFLKEIETPALLGHRQKVVLLRGIKNNLIPPMLHGRDFGQGLKCPFFKYNVYSLKHNVSPLV
ncbi:hypothetical protein MBAV_006111 [Candidatus Magnetobacterium bavaricum]|uniref:Uncharacterized protein n=1 Tax=Candidatus Magnetobacterium bavaricum TaxID=29290 RepID=A0A0F3GIC5_9BACT|nr:hypothetical protein MBAV_006111 [Candidatus Magnetobacterium bavaricum]